MSRIGNRIIQIPANVKVLKHDRQLTVEGPKGKLSLVVDTNIQLEITSTNQIKLTRHADARKIRALHGLYRSLVNNMIMGVSSGFSKELLIEGVGYKVQPKGKDLIFDLGFSHQVSFLVPDGIKVKIVTPTNLIVEGIDRQLVGQVAADIRSLKEPEPYKGKGIRYAGEEIRRKQGKKVG